jgi:hypothetical protein
VDVGSVLPEGLRDPIADAAGSTHDEDAFTLKIKFIDH